MPLPVWFTAGNGPFSVTITPQTEAADGTLTPGTTKTLTGSIDDVEFDSNPTLENIKPISTRRANYVNIEEDNSFTLVEILKGNGENILAALASTADVFVIAVTRGAQAFSFTGRRGQYNEGLKNGKSVGRLQVRQVDTGVANPSYT